VSWWIVIGVLAAGAAVTVLQVWYFNWTMRRTIDRSFDGALDSVIADLRTLRQEIRASFRP
jgi:hypothetical protein